MIMPMKLINLPTQIEHYRKTGDEYLAAKLRKRVGGWVVQSLFCVVHTTVKKQKHYIYSEEQ